MYDRYGHQGLSGQGYQGFQDISDIFSSFGNVFEDFFGFGGTRSNRPRRGADLRYDLQLDFREAVFGVEKEIRFDREANCKSCGSSGAQSREDIVTCPTCQGAGQVRRTQGFFSVATACPACNGKGQIIRKPCRDCSGRGVVAEAKKLSVTVPPGVDNGMKLRVSGEGESGSAGRGDLYIVLHVKEQDEYERDGQTLYKDLPIGIAQAALGTKIETETLDGRKELEVPAGSQHDDLINLQGLGVPRLKGAGRGDLYIRLKIQVPTKLSKDQRELLQQFAKISDEKINSVSGFFHKIFE
jgi:molecular chaperone DnaJ